MADLAQLVHRLDRPPRRPRHPRRRRTITLSVRFAPDEFDGIEQEARRLNLSFGAAVRDFALTSCFHERLRRESEAEDVDE